MTQYVKLVIAAPLMLELSGHQGLGLAIQFLSLTITPLFPLQNVKRRGFQPIYPERYQFFLFKLLLLQTGQAYLLVCDLFRIRSYRCVTRYGSYYVLA